MEGLCAGPRPGLPAEQLAEPSLLPISRQLQKMKNVKMGAVLVLLGCLLVPPAMGQHDDHDDHAPECAGGYDVQGAANEERCCSGMIEVIEGLALTVGSVCPASLQADIVSSLPLLLPQHWLSLCCAAGRCLPRLRLRARPRLGQHHQAGAQSFG